MTGLTTDYARDCKVDFGSYVEASVNVAVTNNNSERTISCVALGPAGNCQGSVKCFDIETGKILYHRTRTLEQELHTVRGAEKHANDKDDEVEDDQVTYDFEPVTSPGDHGETTPREPETEEEVL